MLGTHISEIFQICLILFLLAIFISFCISNIFEQIDEQVRNIENQATKNFAIFVVTFVELFIVAVSYYLVDILLHNIRPWTQIARSAIGYKSKDITLGELLVADYGIHIFLIILLVELNSSLKYNLNQMSMILSVNKLDLS